MMADSRNLRNFGNGKTLNRFAIRNLARETARIANRGDGLALKVQSALMDLSHHLRDYGVRYLEIVEPFHFASWANDLHERLIAGELSSSTTSSYVSAVNTVLATHDRSDLQLSAKAYNLNRGQKFSNRNLANSESSHRAFKAYCMDRYKETEDVRFKALYHSVSIQREAGLRFRESTQIKIGCKDLRGMKLELRRGDGVKNGQPRTFAPLYMEALRHAQEFVQQNLDIFKTNSLIPSSMSYRSYKTWAYKMLEQFRDTNPDHAKYHFHGNRHDFAHREYEKAWLDRYGVKIVAPVLSGNLGRGHLNEISTKTRLNLSNVRSAIKQIYLDIAEKLGHHRVDSSFSYLGK
jgi:hypothetical protein